MTNYIIRSGTHDYSLYKVVNVACCSFVAKLDNTEYRNKMEARLEFKKMLLALHSDGDFDLEYKG